MPLKIFELQKQFIKYDCCFFDEINPIWHNWINR